MMVGANFKKQNITVISKFIVWWIIFQSFLFWAECRGNMST